MDGAQWTRRRWRRPVESRGPGDRGDVVASDGHEEDTEMGDRRTSLRVRVQFSFRPTPLLSGGLTAVWGNEKNRDH
ncbi:hypothetical protein NHX12_008278 [Muraenolepis orangiensis]|uniref:Uncharacterized protein n=1 Tax=Muraenolepis orangiensis TaxID=630683 RepID=A0A9Q0DMK8_9TELE|nr:hypothetical protein NHX12_008278 [Muraenolepis orangiensis]